MWTVWEIPRITHGRPRLPDDLATGWLAFQSATERRRLAPTPQGWQTMTDEQLESLSRTALPTTHWRRPRAAAK